MCLCVCLCVCVCVGVSDFQHKEAAYERETMRRMHFSESDTCHLFSFNGWSHLIGMCVSEEQASSLGLITLNHFAVFVAARLQSEIAGFTVYVFNLDGFFYLIRKTGA